MIIGSIGAANWLIRPALWRRGGTLQRGLEANAGEPGGTQPSTATWLDSPAGALPSTYAVEPRWRRGSFSSEARASLAGLVGVGPSSMSTGVYY